MGNGKKIKLLKYIQLIEKNLNRKSKKFLPLQKGDVIKTHSDTKLIQKYYNYQAKTEVSYGVKNLLSGTFLTLNKMQKNTLLLIDLSKNLDFEEKNKEYIYLNKGNIRLNNCKQIKLKDFGDLRKKIYKSLIRELKKFILLNEKKKIFFYQKWKFLILGMIGTNFQIKY